MKNRKIIKRILLAALLLAAAASSLLYWYLEGAFLPRWTHWSERDLTAVMRDRPERAMYSRYPADALESSEASDSAGNPGTDGSGADTGRDVPVRVVLKNRSVCVYEGNDRILRTRRGLKVSEALTGDLDGDGRDEIILLLWKRGSFGSSRPFWEKNDTRRFSQHIFIYTMINGEIVPWWSSSAIGMKAAEISLQEKPGGRGKKICITEPEGSASVWAWGGFGLYKTETAEVPAEGNTQETEISSGEDKRGEAHIVRFLAAGDNLISNAICDAAYDESTGTCDFSALYAPIREEVQSHDLAAVSEETILVHDPSQISSGPFFGTPDVIGDDLHDAGFNIITSANNHAFDKGITGIEDTIRFWEKYPDVTLLGIHGSKEDSEKIDYLEKNSIRFALFNYSAGTGRAVLPEDQAFRIDLLDRKEKLLSDLETAEKSADLSIVFVHMGVEYEEIPTEEQRELARELTAAGADLIIGTHPHCVQPMETVHTENGGTAVVYYSLGNLVSTQMKVSTVLGGLAEVVIEKGDSGTSIRSAEMIPVVCHMQAPEKEGGKPFVAAYLLSDYTEEMAENHYLNRFGQNVTLSSLKEHWERVTGQVLP